MGRPFGIGKDARLVQAYGENLSDTRAELMRTDLQSYKGVTAIRSGHDRFALQT
jgi:hypothetical protein